jgi:hypothetical protein
MTRIYPVFAGDQITIPAERYCRSCADCQDILREGFAPGPTGTPELQIWPAGWWCSKRGRRTEEVGCCEEFRPGKQAGPRVVTT